MFSYHDVKQYVATSKINWLERISEECKLHTSDNREGPYLQFRTDWISQDITYALRQTLRYVGFGYVDHTIFKDLGKVIQFMLDDMENIVEGE